ncbi:MULTISPECIES: LytR/AlgR family response regulator transcription factor [Olivibacter]|jgi:DNA-binding LytR/AlgR family response regulator|uniref:Two component transcriptional regulator, LytTR family n=2 Tax=Sphingobacteriaceae TaxID=84566 RepID=F4C2T2_SPHS2|nr:MULTISPECIES: LytTR family DNA-binding domain-containing protein [Olivibacter]MCL4642050.1 LytTR family DNA-binding domain-containing protein [Olivibacter sp. UJ_SKK_5.1]MDM8173288.1 LytTR family DNA-binding domain-containing protein [Olivibacter sp. 47]MDX3915266.1 LytTR family DNA-binding domain-containing protein [Pseudosphingobacterium sp.]
MLRCIIIEDEPLARKGISEHITQIPFVSLEASFETAMDAIVFLSKNNIDVVISDINMPGINGVDFLKSLSKRPLFIFITGRADYALESFELEVFDYILKPYSFERLFKALSRAQSHLTRNDVVEKVQTGTFAIKDNYRNYLVPYHEIQYVEGDREYIRISTTEREFLIIYSLKKITNDLPQDVFLRTHKSYIINKNFVRAVDPDKIIMRGSIKDIPIGVTYRDEVYKKLVNH